tara:strand:+ start:335 stop:523 length:189 start_codon:yes stop_codon:yes gene_type:complete
MQITQLAKKETIMRAIDRTRERLTRIKKGTTPLFSTQQEALDIERRILNALQDALIRRGGAQ